VVQTPCGPIEYAAAGVGEPVLVVHGAGGGFDQGIDFARALAGRGWRVIAMSRFGYLRTPLPAEASAAAQADAHACLLDALDIRRAAIIGASAGAPSSLQFAVRHPERCTALVLLVPAAYVPRPGGAASLTTPAWTRLLASTALRSDFLLWAAIRLAPSTVIGSLLATPPEVVQRASAGEQARVAEILDHILPVSARRLGLMNDAAISLADDGFGTYDGARYTAEHIPGARFIGYARGGHVWVGHQEEVAAAIATFLGAATGRR
jgi:pimeloyl-ACP methyl ester carboxylesterase